MEWIRPNLENYDEDAPQTWPKGAARDEALNLKAWIDWDNYREYEDLPDIPEKAEALELMKERNELDAWFDAQDGEALREAIRNEEPDFLEHDKRANEIEERLDALDRLLERKMPKNAERRLEKLIAVETKEAEREFQLFEESDAA